MALDLPQRPSRPWFMSSAAVGLDVCGAGAVVEVEIGGSFPQRNRPYYGGKFCLLTPRVFLLYLLDIVLMYLGPRM
jgi:hypothetical protein